MSRRQFSETEKQAMKGLQAAGYSWPMVQNVALYIRNNVTVGHSVTSANIDPNESIIKFSNGDVLTITQDSLNYDMV